MLDSFSRNQIFIFDKEHFAKPFSRNQIFKIDKENFYKMNFYI